MGAGIRVVYDSRGLGKPSGESSDMSDLVRGAITLALMVGFVVYASRRAGKSP